MSGSTWAMQKVSLVRCGPPFWMTLRPPQGLPSPCACDLLAKLYLFTTELRGDTDLRRPQQQLYLTRQCQPMSSRAGCWWPAVPAPVELPLARGASHHGNLACQERCGVYSQGPAMPDLPRQALFKATKDILKWENHRWWHAFTPVMLYYSLSLWLLVP